jgi:hypothetical protein
VSDCFRKNAVHLTVHLYNVLPSLYYIPIWVLSESESLLSCVKWKVPKYLRAKVIPGHEGCRPVLKLAQAVFEEDIRPIYVKWECDRHLAVLSPVILMQFHMPCQEQPDHAKKARAVITHIVEDLVIMLIWSASDCQPIYCFMILLFPLCLKWGLSGLKTEYWEVDLVRTLLHIL